MTPTLQQAIDNINGYLKWWDKGRSIPEQGVVIGQLTHTRRRLRLIQEAEKKSGWTKITTNQKSWPKEDVKVVAWDGYSTQFAECTRLTKGRILWYYEDYIIQDITHWMPKPLGPSNKH
jgi:hypothetical protein